MTKLCIFCGGHVDSREHVWPQWLLELIKKWPSKNMRLHAARLNKHGAIDKWKIPNPTIVVNCVCRECNNEWMAELEGNARPILAPLIDGSAKIITFSQQVVIAAWITKCSMIFDSMESGESFYEQEDMIHFRKSLIPPIDHTEIWMGHYSGPNLFALTVHGTGLNRVAKPPTKSYIMTMAFGRLVVQFASVKLLVPTTIPIINIKVKRGPWDHVAVRLLPEDGGAIHWPPKHCFDDSSCTIQSFADRFGLKGLE